MTIEEIPEEKEINMGGVSDQLLEPNEHYIPLPEPNTDDDDLEELEERTVDETKPLY